MFGLFKRTRCCNNCKHGEGSSPKNKPDKKIRIKCLHKHSKVYSQLVASDTTCVRHEFEMKSKKK